MKCATSPRSSLAFASATVHSFTRRRVVSTNFKNPSLCFIPAPLIYAGSKEGCLFRLRTTKCPWHCPTIQIGKSSLSFGNSEQPFHHIPVRPRPMVAGKKNAVRHGTASHFLNAMPDFRDPFGKCFGHPIEEHLFN